MKRFNIAFAIICLLQLLFLFEGCVKENETKYVDLRFRVEDSYFVDAVSPQQIQFLVKSTEPWEILGDESWYTVNPNSGPAGETATVTISFNENTDLDDRSSEISIKSDYWVGKTFLVTQKGCAFLRADKEELSMPKKDNISSITIESNQDWSSVVTEGDNWLEIISGSQGKLDGEIKIKSKENKGEMRKGEVTVYDRHTKPMLKIICNQDGLILQPISPDNGKWFALQAEKQRFTIPVTSDMLWTAEKSDKTQEWFTINSETTKDCLVLDLEANYGKSVREGTIILKSVPTDDSRQIVKKVKFKQINAPYCETVVLNETIKGTYVYKKEGMLYGKYIFYLKSGMTAKMPLFQLLWKWGPGNLDHYRVEYHIRNNIAMGLTRPWNSHINCTPGPATEPFYRKINPNVNNTIGFEIKENTSTKPSSGTFIFWVNGEKVADTSNIPGSVFAKEPLFYWERMSAETGVLTISLETPDGFVTVEKYDYYPPLIWGE